MSMFSNFLNLFKYEPTTDAQNTFNIQTALNDNWDKLDDFAENINEQLEGKTDKNTTIILDANSAIKNGKYAIASAGGSNIPILNQTFIIEVSQRSDSWIVQRAKCYSLAPYDTYERCCLNDTWTTWIKIATVNDIQTGLSLGETSATAYRGDRGKTAYDHSQSAHAPSNAQKNSDITKAEIEAKLTGQISTHSHTSDNTKAPTNHASSSSTYGLGTETQYGHVAIANHLSATTASPNHALSANQGRILNETKAPNHVASASLPSSYVGNGVLYGVY